MLVSPTLCSGADTEMQGNTAAGDERKSQKTGLSASSFLPIKAVCLKITYSRTGSAQVAIPL